MSAPRPIPVITDGTGVIHSMLVNGVAVGQVRCQESTPDEFARVSELQALVYRLPACQRCWVHGLVTWPKAARS